ncbi:hypothetical protein D3C78_937470 [compost metagenome]
MDGAFTNAYGRIQERQNVVCKGQGLFLRVVPANGHREFVAAHSGQHTALRHPLAERLCQQNNEFIAHVMAVNIIHILKAVQIDKDHGFYVDIAAQTHPFQLFDQRASIRQMAQPVGTCHASGLIFTTGEFVQPHAAHQNEQQNQRRGQNNNLGDLV